MGGAPCCAGLRRFGIGSLVFVAIAASTAAAYFAGSRNSLAARLQTPQQQLIAELPILEATAAVTSEKFSMATGSISEDADGLFVLDHNSGLLQCSVLYPRLGGQFMAQFTTNVAAILGSAGKGGTYMMVTGRADFPRSNRTPAASTVIYVMDTATGNFACFGVPFDRVAMNANRPQQATLVLITQGSANPLIDRDNLR